MTLASDIPPLDYVETETDDLEDYAPNALTQSLMGAAIMITIGLAFYGLAEILQEVQATFMGLR